MGWWAYCSPSRGLLSTGFYSRNELVGGQLIVVSAQWGGSNRKTLADPTGLGSLTEVVLGVTGGKIQILGV